MYETAENPIKPKRFDVFYTVVTLFGYCNQMVSLRLVALACIGSYDFVVSNRDTSTQSQDGQMASIFLSHSSSDKPVARKLRQDLESLGFDVWLDEYEILVGDSISQEIAKGLDRSDFIAVLLSENSVTSGWVEKEWQVKIGREASERGVFILPIRLDDCKAPVLLRDKRYADLRGDYDSAVDDIVQAIRGHLNRQDSDSGQESMNNTHVGSAETARPSMSRSVLTLALIISISILGFLVFRGDFTGQSDSENKFDASREKVDANGGEEPPVKPKTEGSSGTNEQDESSITKDDGHTTDNGGKPINPDEFFRNRAIALYQELEKLPERERPTRIQNIGDFLLPNVLDAAYGLDAGRFETVILDCHDPEQLAHLLWGIQAEFVRERFELSQLLDEPSEIEPSFAHFIKSGGAARKILRELVLREERGSRPFVKEKEFVPTNDGAKMKALMFDDYTQASGQLIDEMIDLSARWQPRNILTVNQSNMEVYGDKAFGGKWEGFLYAPTERQYTFSYKASGQGWSSGGCSIDMQVGDQSVFKGVYGVHGTSGVKAINLKEGYQKVILWFATTGRIQSCDPTIKYRGPKDTEFQQFTPATLKH